ncbi:MAG TPA: DUF4238 domain-containing protein [bacterium]
MPKKSTARRHHYLPQAYLAQFTDLGTKEGRFHVLEIETGRKFRTSPKNVAVELDFNRVDVDGHPPDFVENVLSPMEQAAVESITNTVALGDFPSDEDYSAILHLICLIAVRNPLFRKSFNRAREHSIRVIADLLTSDEKIWKYHVQKAKEDGMEIPYPVSFEDMKRFIENRDYEIDFHPQSNLQVELKIFSKMLPILHERTWSLIIASSDGPEFICSDHPVALDFKSKCQGPIGLKSRETELFFPLTRRAGFYGTFEDPLKPVIHAKPGNVANMNRRVAFNAERHVYSCRDSFAIWLEGEIRIIDCAYNK